MKHIKRFNESEIISMRRDLLLLCRNHLIDMVDNWGTTFFILKGEDHYNVEIKTSVRLNWLDVKDIFIPFFTILSMKYNPKPYSGNKILKMTNSTNSIFNIKALNNHFTRNDVINDRIDNNIDCSCITFNIKKDKRYD